MRRRRGDLVCVSLGLRIALMICGFEADVCERLDERKARERFEGDREIEETEAMKREEEEMRKAAREKGKGGK